MRDTIEEIKAQLAALEHDRQHGRKGKPLADKAAEEQRLKNNLSSRLSRLRKKELEKYKAETFGIRGVNKFSKGLQYADRNADEFGITPLDERRYKGAFMASYQDEPVELAYIRRMTGLSLAQIEVMQERTGLIPSPKVTLSDAEAEEREFIANGERY